MSSVRSGGDTRKISKGRRLSSLVEDADGGGNVGGEGPLKKGPWTAAEDAILVEYVKKHGQGNWNTVQKHSGLARCGKSCRLRWANHLRPDLKKGAFTAEEENRILELHANMGNKWARMAAEVVGGDGRAGLENYVLPYEVAKAEIVYLRMFTFLLPGRTDNEIKNYWNTRIKRMQRAGLPVYPAELCQQILNGNHESQHVGALTNDALQHDDLSQTDNFDISDVDFKNLKFCHGLSHGLSIFEMPESNFEQNPDSSHGYNFLFPTMHPAKRLRESEMLYHSFGNYMSNAAQLLDLYDNYACEKISDHPRLCPSCDPIVNTSHPFRGDNLTGSHAKLNGNASSSMPISGAMKLELPSLQYPETQYDRWGTPTSPLPSLESVDTLIQSPPVEPILFDPISPHRNGLLESVIYNSKSLKDLNSGLLLQETPGKVNKAAKSSNLNHPFETEWDEQGEPNSPLGQSVASVPIDFTPISMCSVDGPQSSIETNHDHDDKHDDALTEFLDSPTKKENLNQIDFTRPDALLDLGWFGNSTECGSDQSALKDALSVLLGDDCEGQQ